MLVECLWRPNSGCEHSEAVDGAFQQWWQQCERQVVFWTALHSTKWRASQSAIVSPLWTGIKMTVHTVETWIQSPRWVKSCALSFGIGKRWSFWIYWNLDKSSIDCCIAVLTKLKAQPSRVRPGKTIFLLHHDHNSHCINRESKVWRVEWWCTGLLTSVFNVQSQFCRIGTQESFPLMPCWA